MFSHMMVGSNDLERSKQFYDGAVRQGGQARTTRAALSYGRKRRGVHGHLADRRRSRRRAAMARPIGFTFDSPKKSTPGTRRASRRAAPRSRIRPASRERLRQALSRLSARSRRQQTVRAAPAGAMTLEIVSAKSSARRACSWSSIAMPPPPTAHRHDLLGLPAAAGGAGRASCRSLWYLSGLTCTHANVTEKGEYRAACAEHGLIFVAPDTSPRGDDVPDDPEGCGISARARASMSTRPRSRGRRISACGPTSPTSLPALVAADFPVDMERQGITGHSMGGHGALTLALEHPGRFRSVSAFAPIVAPSQVPWGQKALRRLSRPRSRRRGASTTPSR